MIALSRVIGACARKSALLLVRSTSRRTGSAAAWVEGMRWRWRRLLIVPLLVSAHACDGGYGGGGCSGGGVASCGPIEVLPCGLLGQCTSEGGTCPTDLRLDPS